MEAVDILARQDYEDRGHPFRPQPGILLESLRASLQAERDAQTQL